MLTTVMSILFVSIHGAVLSAFVKLDLYISEVGVKVSMYTPQVPLCEVGSLLPYRY